jgi:hypothetical protein
VKEQPPHLLDGQKIHYPIFHDETCIHANDLANFLWLREGEQPLRNKSRGRVIHVSDFIIEHCGRLCLNADEIAEQMKLPLRPSPPNNAVNTNECTAISNPVDMAPAATSDIPATANTSKSKPKKAARKKNTKKASPEGRSLAEQESAWIAPPPPAPFTSYRLSSFDARRIIYPGANHDPWWDMPQLIAQVSVSTPLFILLSNNL